MVPQVVSEPTGADGNDGNIEFMPEVGEDLHVLAELDSDPGQEIAPDQRADECENREHPEVRFEYAGWK